jgi:hypothetical protein
MSKNENKKMTVTWPWWPEGMMSEQQQTTLPPGRELDAAVSKRLGLPAVYHYPENWPYCNCKNLMYQTNKTGSGWDEVPYYSTDIAAAWELVEYATGKGYDFALIRDVSRPDLNKQYACEFDTDAWNTNIGETTYMRGARADTAAHAICLAFLQVPDGV